MSGWLAVRPAMEATGQLFMVTRRALEGSQRHRTISRARFVAALVMRWAGLSYPEIGHAMNRDHSTAIYYVQKANGDASLWDMARAVASSAGVMVPESFLPLQAGGGC